MHVDVGNPVSDSDSDSRSTRRRRRTTRRRRRDKERTRRDAISASASASSRLGSRLDPLPSVSRTYSRRPCTFLAPPSLLTHLRLTPLIVSQSNLISCVLVSSIGPVVHSHPTCYSHTFQTRSATLPLPYVLRRLLILESPYVLWLFLLLFAGFCKTALHAPLDVRSSTTAEISTT